MTSTTTNHAQIGKRLRALREKHNLKQDQMTTILGIKDRQSVSQIENGARKLSAQELVAAIAYFGVSLDDLTNPFLLSDKDSFSWRQNGVASKDLDAFERRAGEWIGAYRELADATGGSLRRLLPRLGLKHTSSFEGAVSAGESVAKELELGLRPAFGLAEKMESRLGILVLMVDATAGISGAACRLPDLNAVLVNRNETRARRASDLGHELFHLLTWDAMKPARVESSLDSWDRPKTRDQHRNLRIEQLADNFASGLLMPTTALESLGDPKGNLVDWLTAGAFELGVSSRALKWRLVNSRRLGERDAPSTAELNEAARAYPLEPAPPAYSRTFIATIARGIATGHVSSARACTLLGLDRNELLELCVGYGIAAPEELGGRVENAIDG